MTGSARENLPAVDWRADVAIRFAGRVTVAGDVPVVVSCERDDLVDLARYFGVELGMTYGSLVVEQTPEPWHIQHIFYGGDAGGFVALALRLSPVSSGDTELPSIAAFVHGADWHEREAENVFGLVFTGHPRLGDFVLHEHWPEGTHPMSAGFAADQPLPPNPRAAQWQPPRLVDADGAFAMPVGPVLADFSEAALFLLETVGEDVLRTIPRFFYKYRGIEKLAEGRSAAGALLLAERFSGTAAFAHGLAFCDALETIAGTDVPPRARALRLVGAELERIRHHTAVIAKLCGSTALAVGASLAAILAEQMLRISCRFAGHRYLFGLNLPGGLSVDVDDEVCRSLVREVEDVFGRLQRLHHKLEHTSSFLDRIEEVGAISRRGAIEHGLVGPVARASGVGCDLRRDIPYGPYRAGPGFQVAGEEEGDGYARLRLFFSEIGAALDLLRATVASLPGGAVRAPWEKARPGAALGWVEAPGGAALHWLRIGDDGNVRRWRVGTPSFTNWHGFHLAAEGFAFQDFPIILASMGLSVAENDR